MEQIENVDILIVGGHVIDPEAGISKKMDVALKDGVIFQVDEDLRAEAKKRVDVHGDYVVPGLIDMHCHIYPAAMYDDDCLPNVNGEAHMFQSGITTAVDAGTCGWRDFLNFKGTVIDKSGLRILSFVNIACGGMVTLHSEQTPTDFHPPAAAAVAHTFPEQVAGIGHNELGTLKPGGCADLAVIRKVNGDYGYTDCGNAKINGSSRLECIMTVRAGEIVYNPHGLGMPEWKAAPPAYWEVPGVL